MDMETEKYRKQIGKTLQSAREVQGWSVWQVAEMVGVKPSTIEKMEAGEFDVKLSQIGKVCDVLGCSLTIKTNG